MKLRTLLLTNPGSRSGESALETVGQELELLGELTWIKPEGPAEWSRIIESHADRVDQVVIGGGDGSVNLALDGLIRTGLPMGLLPLGTANDLARSLGLPSDPADALEVIRAGRRRRIDVGWVNDCSFINAVGLGLGPSMTRELSSESKSRWGVGAYLIGLSRALRRHRAFRARIDSPERSDEAHYVQITVANGIHYGGGMMIADDARLNDGQLDVLLIRPQSWPELLANLLRLRLGRVHDDLNLTHWRCQEVTITTPRPMDVTADGELVARTPVVCRVRPGALTVFAPDETALNQESPT